MAAKHRRGNANFFLIGFALTAAVGLVVLIALIVNQPSGRGKTKGATASSSSGSGNGQSSSSSSTRGSSSKKPKKLDDDGIVDTKKDPDANESILSAPSLTGKAASAQISAYRMGNGSAIARLLPDGKQAVSAAGSVLQLVKLDSSTVITNFYGHSDSILALRISPTGRCLATGSLDKTARVWSFDGGRRLRLLRHTDSVEGVAFSPNDELLATATRGILGKGKDRAGMCLWDAVEGRLIYDSPTKSLPHVAILGDNEHAVMSWAEKSFLLWSLSTRPNTAENQDPGNKGKSVLVPAGANRLLLGDGDGDVILWDPNLDAPKAIARAKGDSSGIIDLAASEDGRRFAAVSGKSSGILQVWDDRGREIGKLEVSGPIRSVSMSSNGRYVLIAQRDGSVRLFDVEKMR